MVSGVMSVREKLVDDDWKQIETGRTDDQFLGEMIDRYRKLMFGVALSVTHNDYDAEDVVQKVCVRFVINGIPAGLRENPPAYLVGCIKNEAKNVHRTRERRGIDEKVDLESLSSLAIEPTSQALLEALEEAKVCLTPEEREVLELFYTQGFTQADIAGKKGMEEDAVAQKLSRSRKKMKKAIHSIGRLCL